MVNVDINNLGVLTRELIDLGGSKLASRNLVLEKDIELTIGATHWLRKTEVRPDEEQETAASPEKSRLWSPVPGVDSQHCRYKSRVDDTTHVVEVSGEHDSLDLETGRWDFGNEAVADGANRKIVDKGEDHEKGTNSPGCS